MSRICQSVLVDRNGRRMGEVATLAADLKHGHFIREHAHPEDQLLFAARGVMTVRMGDDVWVVPPMCAVWIPAATTHSVAVSGELSMRTLYFWPGVCGALPETCAVIHVSALLRELVLRACEYPRLRRRVEAERHLLDVIVDQLSVSEEVPLQLSQPTDARAVRIAEAVAKDPADGRSLERLCRDCGASKRTIQ
ncbi:MAG: AraC family ligand binding domain-containing protein, partial [Acidobacteriota bacterium]